MSSSLQKDVHTRKMTRKPLSENFARNRRTLASRCYFYMFQWCTSLTEAPKLPATTLFNNCYYAMFCNCTNLNSITCLATYGTGSGSTQLWLANVSAKGTFVKAKGMTSWTQGQGDNGIPEGWTVKDYVAPVEP